MLNEITDAIISGSASPLISGITSSYVLIKNAKHLKEIIVIKSTEKFIEKRDDYIKNYNLFEKQIVSIVNANQNDGTSAVEALYISWKFTDKDTPL